MDRLGHCPQCGADSVFREKRPNGNDECRAGHTYPSSCALADKQALFVSLQQVPANLQPYARIEGHCWVVGAPTSEDFQRIHSGLNDAVRIATDTLAPSLTALPPAGEPAGPLVFAVASHQAAEALACTLGPMVGPNDQGVRVIPFGASALGYCGPGTRLFRALVVLAPRTGAVTDLQFNAWVEKAIVPYLAPNASRISL